MRRDAQPIAALSHAALEHVADAQLAADLLDVDGAPLIGENRIAGRDEEPADQAQRRDDLLDHAVGEKLEFRIAGHVVERQRRDRGFVGAHARKEAGGRRSRRPVPPAPPRRLGAVGVGVRRGQPDAIHPHPAGDVLQLLVAEILEFHIEPAGGIFLHARRDADPARLGHPLQPGGDVDAVAENVVVLDDDVALVNADPKFHAPLRGDRLVALGEFALHPGGASQGIEDALEFHEHAVAGGLDDAPSVFGDTRIDNLAPHRPERRQRAFFVRADQPRVAGNIGGQDSRQPPLHPRFRHRLHLLPAIITLSFAEAGASFGTNARRYGI